MVIYEQRNILHFNNVLAAGSAIIYKFGWINVICASSMSY